MKVLPLATLYGLFFWHAQCRAAQTLTISEPAVREGDTGMAILEFRITRDMESSAPLMVPYGWVEGTATRGTDYIEPAEGVLSFGNGEYEKSLQVTVIADTLSEAAETVSLHIPETTEYRVEGNWTVTATVTPPGIPLSPYAAAVNGELAVVGSTTNDSVHNEFRAWRRTGGNTGRWTVLTPPVFTHPVALSRPQSMTLQGRTLATAFTEQVRFWEHPSRPVIFFHDFDPQSNSWVQTSVVAFPEDHTAYIFLSSGDGVAAAGMLRQTIHGMSSGTVGVIRRAGPPGAAWSIEQQIPEPRPPPNSLENRFAERVLIAGDQLLVSAPGHERAGLHNVFLYRRIAQEWTAIGGFTSLHAPQTPFKPVSFNGEEAVIAAPGALVRHRRNQGGANAWGIVASTPTVAALQPMHFCADGDDVFYAGAPDGLAPAVYRQHGVAGGGWSVPEQLRPPDYISVLAAGSGTLFSSSDRWMFHEGNASAGRILDDDATVHISNARIQEPATAGPVDVEVLVSLNERKGVPVEITWQTEAGTATAGTDYTESSGTLTLVPGAMTGVIRVPVKSDGLAEPRETFRVKLTALSSGTPGTSEALVTITDSNFPAFSSTPLVLREADSGAVSGNLTFSLTTAPAISVSLPFQWGGTAVYGTDFSAPESPLVIPGGQRQALLPVSVTGDLVTETPGEMATLFFTRENGQPPAAGWVHSGSVYSAYVPDHAQIDTTSLDFRDGTLAQGMKDWAASPTGPATGRVVVYERNVEGQFGQTLSFWAGNRIRIGSLVKVPSKTTVFATAISAGGSPEMFEVLRWEKSGALWSGPLTVARAERSSGPQWIDAENDTLALQNGGRHQVEIRMRHAGGLNAWGIVKIIDAPDPLTGGSYAQLVALSGDWLAVSNNDQLHFHQRHAGGPDAWGMVQILEAPALPGRPDSIDMDGDSLIFGSLFGESMLAALDRKGPPEAPWVVSRLLPGTSGYTPHALRDGLLLVDSRSTENGGRILGRHCGGQYGWGVVTEFPAEDPLRLSLEAPFAIDDWTIVSSGSRRQLPVMSPVDALVTIEDNDPSPFISLPATAYISEKNRTAYIPVPLTNIGGSASLRYELTPGTALAGKDFVIPSTPVTYISSGDITTFQFPVTLATDSVPEHDETFTLKIISSDGKVLQDTCVVTIVDDDVDLRRATAIPSAIGSMKYHLPSPASYNAAWVTAGFDDAGWIDGSLPAGYETVPGTGTSYERILATDLHASMFGRNTGVLFRIPVRPPAGAIPGRYLLSIRGDEGYSAWLNGWPVGAMNMAAPPHAASKANGSRSEPVPYETLPLQDVFSNGGTGLLGIHGVTVSTRGPDFLVDARLLFAPLPSRQWLEMISTIPGINATTYHPEDDADRDGLPNATEYVLSLPLDKPGMPVDPLIECVEATRTARPVLRAALPPSLRPGCSVVLESGLSLSGAAWKTKATLRDNGVWEPADAVREQHALPSGYVQSVFNISQSDRMYFRLRFTADL